jgi:hypothetical protein
MPRGFAGEQDDGALATLYLLPAAQEQIDLLAASNERRRARAQRLEPALGGARAQRLPCLDGLGEAFERDRPEFAVVEQAAGQPACARRNYHHAGFSQRL